MVIRAIASGFRQSLEGRPRPDFNRRLEKRFGDEWPELCAEFALFTHDIEHGYDFERSQLDWQPGKPLSASGAIDHDPRRSRLAEYRHCAQGGRNLRDFAPQGATASTTNRKSGGASREA